MADKRIVTKQELNYIETLYLQCNLEDFIIKDSTSHDLLLGEEKQNGKKVTQSDIDKIYGKERYEHMLIYVHDTILSNGEYLSESNGRMWYQLPNYRMGIMDYDKAKKSNQYNIVIQYEWEHLYSLSANLKGLDLPFDGTRDQYQFKRVDLTKIFQSDFDYLTNKGFISPYRKMHIEKNNDIVETVYLGHRNNGNVYRMYNKTIELKTDTEKHPINYKKIELLSKYFGNIEDLYTFELELHRSYLKEQLNITTLDQLDKLYTAYHSIVGKIRIYEDTDQNKEHLLLNHRHRIDANTITEYKEYKKVYRAKHKPSKQYAMDKQNKIFNRYIESMGITDEKEINKLKLEFGMNIVSNDKQDVTIEYSDSQMETEYKDTYNKIQLMRDNQDDQLFKESNEAFAPIMTQSPNDLF